MMALGGYRVARKGRPDRTAHPEVARNARLQKRHVPGAPWRSCDRRNFPACDASVSPRCPSLSLSLSLPFRTRSLCSSSSSSALTSMTTHFPRRTSSPRVSTTRVCSSYLLGGKTLPPHPSLSLRLTRGDDGYNAMTTTATMTRATTTTTTSDGYRDRYAIIATAWKPKAEHAIAGRAAGTSRCTTVERRRLFSFDGTRKLNEVSGAAAAAAAPSRLWRAAGRAGLRASTLVNPVRQRAAAPAAEDRRAPPESADAGRLRQFSNGSGAAPRRRPSASFRVLVKFLAWITCAVTKETLVRRILFSHRRDATDEISAEIRCRRIEG